MKNNRILSILLTLVLVLSLVGCGDTTTQTAVTGTEEQITTTVPETTNESNESVKETDPDASYVENNMLVFEETTAVTTNGTLYIGTDYEGTENPVINVDWEITNIAISDAKDGIQTVIIEQESRGYIWVDDAGNIFATNLNIPVGRLCDIYTGTMIPVGKETATDTEIEWKGETYTVSAIETTEWIDGDWSTDWVEDPNGGERLSSTLKMRMEITVTEDYDGLALVLVPITDENGSVDGDTILDVWSDGSYMFNIGELSAKFESGSDTEVGAEETPIPTETQAPAETQEPAEATTKPVEEPQKPAESTPKPTEAPVTHTHSYTSVVTRQATCTVAGEKTYTCSCGDSYTENLGTVAHDYSVPVTQIVHHEEQWGTVSRTVKVKRLRCSCGEYFTNTADWDAHSAANIEAEGIYSSCAGAYLVEEVPETVYDYVLISEAYDEEVIVGYKCSVCGQQK